MTAKKYLQLHPLLSDRVRLGIMGVLASANGPVSFNELIEAMDLTKGNLSSHIKRLEEDGLLTVKKKFVDRKPRTTYECSDYGRETLNEYLVQVQQLLRKTRHHK